MSNWKVLVCGFVVGFVTGAADCRARALADESIPHEWYDSTHGWLSRAVVAEAGWTSEDDHVGIANVLLRRLAVVRKMEGYEGYTFTQQIRNYCSGLAYRLPNASPRAKWVRNLPYEMPATDPGLRSELEAVGWGGIQYAMPRPKHWPRKLPWQHYAMYWNEVLKRMQKWQNGGFGDACPEAMHWGSDTGLDRTNAVDNGWIEVDCGNTVNKFYKLPD